MDDLSITHISVGFDFSDLVFQKKSPGRVWVTVIFHQHSAGLATSTDWIHDRFRALHVCALYRPEISGDNDCYQECEREKIYPCGSRSGRRIFGIRICEFQKNPGMERQRFIVD